MGRERQKAKRRSGRTPVTQKPKKTKKPLLANSFLSQHWDKKQTLSQNYKRLGLSSKINKATGGTEGRRTISGLGIEGTAGANEQDSLAIGRPQQRFEVAEARIERDPETGAILSVVEDPRSKAAGGQRADGPYKALTDPLEELDAMVGNRTEGPLSLDVDEEVGNSDVVKELQRKAALPSVPKKRKQSDRERAFLEKLMAKYGTEEDKGCFEKMARDMKINVMQQSAGDLRKRVRKYQTENNDTG